MGPHETDDQPSTARPRWMAPVAALVVVGAGLGGYAWSQRRAAQSGSAQPAPTSSAVQGTASGPASPTCANPVGVPVAVAPGLKAVVTAAADRAIRAGACATYAVTAQTAAETLAAMSAGSVPAAWVPEATPWVDDLKKAMPTAPVSVGAPVATTPLVLAMPAALAAKGTVAPAWTDLVGGQVRLRISDPTKNASSRLALTTALSAMGGTQQAITALGGAVIALSKTAATTEAELFTKAAAPGSAEAFPTTEAALAAYNSAHSSAPLAAVMPTGGTGLLDHPFVTMTGAPSPVEAATAGLLTQLTSAEGKTTLRAAGYRTSATDPGATVTGIPDGVPTYLAAPPAEATAGLLSEWGNVKKPMKMLAVVDVSGSMKTKVGTSTRRELAYQAGLTALGVFPPDTQLGLWQFGYRPGGVNQDWLEVVPMRSVTEKVGGRAQGELLGEGFQRIAARPAGGTGLYDTVFDAYKALLAQHDQTRVNALVLLTDGKNEDPYSRSLADLLAQLRQMKDPTKPMRSSSSAWVRRPTWSRCGRSRRLPPATPTRRSLRMRSSRSSCRPCSPPTSNAGSVEQLRSLW
jgi:Ca-activated chloride channel family protein